MATLYAETCRDIGLRPARAPRERDPEGWLTFAQAAARLGVSERTLRKLVDDGELAYVDVGRGKERRSPRFAPQDIEISGTAQGAVMAVYKRGEIYHYEFELQRSSISRLYGLHVEARSPRVRTSKAERSGASAPTS